MERAQLNDEEIEKEMAAISKTGLQEILILTGESRSKSTVEYIGNACKIARKYFKVIGLEIYPVNSDEYAYLHECGADYVTVFQETYNSDKYETLHLAGHKRIFPYRVNAQERALKRCFCNRIPCLSPAEKIPTCRNRLLLSETSSDHQQRPHQSDGRP